MSSGNKENIRKLAVNIKNNPGDLFSKFALALELLKCNEVDKARLLFESIYRQDPEYLGVYYHLGKLYQSAGLHRKALEMFENGIEVAIQKNDLRTKSELYEAINQLRHDSDEHEI